jgi:hypothetical protein
VYSRAIVPTQLKTREITFKRVIIFFISFNANEFTLRKCRPLQPLYTLYSLSGVYITAIVATLENTREYPIVQSERCSVQQLFKLHPEKKKRGE